VRELEVLVFMLGISASYLPWAALPGWRRPLSVHELDLVRSEGITGVQTCFPFFAAISCLITAFRERPEPP